MYRLKTLSLLCVTGFIASCASTSTNFTETGNIKHSSLSDDCNVTIYTTKPKMDFDELGIIDVTYKCTPPFSWCPEDMNKASFFREVVKPEVCRAGGNAILLWESNGWAYTKTTVIRTK